MFTGTMLSKDSISGNGKEIWQSNNLKMKNNEHGPMGEVLLLLRQSSSTCSLVDFGPRTKYIAVVFVSYKYFFVLLR